VFERLFRFKKGKIRGKWFFYENRVFRKKPGRRGTKSDGFTIFRAFPEIRGRKKCRKSGEGEKQWGVLAAF